MPKANEDAIRGKPRADARASSRTKQTMKTPDGLGALRAKMEMYNICINKYISIYIYIHMLPPGSGPGSAQNLSFPTENVSPHPPPGPTGGRGGQGQN